MSQSAERGAAEAAAPTVGSYSRLMRNHWVVLTLGLLVGLALALAFLAARPTTYTSSTSVLLTSTGVDETGQSSPARNTVPLNLDTEAQLVRSDAVIDTAISELGADEAPRSFARRVSVSVPPNSEVLVVSFRAQEADLAERGSAAVASAYLEARGSGAQEVLDARIAVLEEQLVQLRPQLATAAVAVTETTPESPERLLAAAERDRLLAEIAATDTRRRELDRVVVTPGTVVTGATAAQSDTRTVTLVSLVSGPFAGLLVGLGVALLLERTRRVVRDGSDLAAVSSYPVAARLPFGFGPGTRTPAHKQSLVFHRLRTQIGHHSYPLPAVVLVVGVSPGAAAHGVATGLSKAYADGDVAVRRTCTDPSAPRLCAENSSTGPQADRVVAPRVPSRGEREGVDRVLVLHARSTRETLEAQGLLTRADVVVLVVEEHVSRHDDVENAAQQLAEGQLDVGVVDAPPVVTVLVARPPRWAGRPRSSRHGAGGSSTTSGPLSVRLGTTGRPSTTSGLDKERAGRRSAALERS